MNTTYSRLKKKALMKDWALGLGTIPPADRRIQVKMPKSVVDQLDALYPDIDRSEVITKLAIQAIHAKLRFIDRPLLGDLVDEDQQEMNEMWDYLEKRDANL